MPDRTTTEQIRDALGFAAVTFDGTGAILNQTGPIANVVRNGVGDYTVNLTVAFQNTDFHKIASSDAQETQVSTGSGGSQLDVLTYNSAGAAADAEVSVVVFR